LIGYALKTLLLKEFGICGNRKSKMATTAGLFFCSHGTLNGERNARRFLEITNNLPPNCAQMITGRSLQR
jgi:hypothetical protein